MTIADALMFTDGIRYIYVIAPDPMAGRRGRYTTHRIDTRGTKRTKVIGRELTMGHSKRIVWNLIRGEP